jgi:uncharacterized protein YuzE
MATIDYDEKNDILHIHSGFRPGERFKTNEVYGKVILDIADSGRIVGLEILCASELVDTRSIKPVADFTATRDGHGLRINLSINGSSTEIAV